LTAQSTTTLKIQFTATSESGADRIMGEFARTHDFTKYWRDEAETIITFVVQLSADEAEEIYDQIDRHPNVDKAEILQT